MSKWRRQQKKRARSKSKQNQSNLLCFSCDKRKQIYCTGLCQVCHDVAMKESKRLKDLEY